MCDHQLLDGARSSAVALLTFDSEAIVGKMTINGVTIDVPPGASVSVVGGTILINGQPASTYVQPAEVVVNIVGDVGQVQVEGSVFVTGDCGSVESKGSVEISGSVSGNVNANGSVEIGGPVTGSVQAGGSVECGKVGGDVRAGGSVSRR